MNSAIARLLTLRVSDVMSKQVVCLSHHDSMQRAAQELLAHEISGAPVVDDQRRCAGVLSAFDFIRERVSACRASNESQHAFVQERHDRPLCIDRCGHDQVCDYMNAAVQSIGADQPLLTAARIMCSQHIHRLPVLDRDSRPVGVVTSLDVVAALVNAIEE